MNIFEELQKTAAVAADLYAAQGLMAWDQEVYMPSGSVLRRASQMGTLAGLRHDVLLKQLRPQLDQVEKEKGLSETQSRNVAQLRYSIDRESKLSKEFVTLLAQKCGEAQSAWEIAKKKSDFSLFEKPLTELVELKRKEADYLGYEESPYDALLEAFEPGNRSSILEALFKNIVPGLKKLLAETQKGKPVDDTFLYQPIEKDKQWQFSLRVLKDLGYDFSKGRQDISTHPFSIGLGMEDVRITTRIEEKDITSMLYSTIHECGHALYEQGLSPDTYGLPQSEACSLGIHESQSRVWENNVGRSLEFWEYYFDAFAALFPDHLRGKGPIDVYRAVNKVEPSLIRIAADELTYHFHILIRFEIEKALIEGKLAVKNLPAVWNEKVKEYIGLDVPSNAQGVLQDVHWSHGSFGYFPTYSLGSFYAAQFIDKALEEQPDLYKGFQKGDFGTFHRWLAGKIYPEGRLYEPQELCKRVTGKYLDVKHFIQYLERKLKLVYSC